MRSFIVLAVIGWFAMAVGGVGYLLRYESTPGEVNLAYPSAIPATSTIKPLEGRATLIFFAHPKCPCTRASLHELARLMTDLDGKLQAYVVIAKPSGADESWTDTDLRTGAETIPNVHVIVDEGERETNLFKAEISGTVLLYDREGNLRFNGGITSARSHEGDNAGSSSIFAIVTETAGERDATAVFGCPIHAKDCNGEMIAPPPPSQ